MKIAIDVDNVIATTTEGVLQYINERLPINLKIEDIKEYWMEKALPEQYRWVIPIAFEDPKMWKNVEMISGATQGIEKLYRDGNVIYFATATTASNFRKKIGFLERNLPFFPIGYVRNNTINIKNKQLLDVDWLIDDYTQNLIGKRRYRSICLDYPWNQDFVDNGDTCRRAKNWKDIYNIIKEWEEYK